MTEYQELKRRLRIAKIGAANIPGGPTVGDGGLRGGPVDRHQRRLKNRADANVRDAAKAVESYRKRHRIIVPEFPGPIAGRSDWRDARIRKQYALPERLTTVETLRRCGWIGMVYTPNGPEFIPAILDSLPQADAPANESPAVTEIAVADPPMPVVADDPQPTCPAIEPEIPVEAPVTFNVTPVMNLRTIGMIAKELRVEQHKALYVIRVRKIHPVARAGMYRLFDDVAVQRIASELQQIASAR